VSEELQIAIVGGGIGGLTAALALRARGLHATIYEQASELREIGAGVSLFPNATTLLQRIGLATEVEKIGSLNTGQVMRSAAGEVLNRTANPSTGFHAYNVHRAELLKLLVGAQAEGAVRLGHRLSAAREDDDRVRLTFSNNATATADVVIGADGIHSVLKRLIGLQANPSSEGIMAYRGLIPIEKLSWAKGLAGGMSRWVGKGRSFLCYPVSSGRLMNLVAFVPTNLESEESWTAPGDLEALRAEYAGWDDPVIETIGALEHTFRWGIYDRAPLPYWSVGRMTLLGDAAHAMVPHLGQGAAQAIEDGFTLAVFLEGATRHDVPKRLQAYEAARLGWTSRLQTMARETGRFFRAEFENEERDRFTAKWMATNDQIRAHDAEKTAKEALALAQAAGTV
jgi:salicylate hydroxylase